VAGGLALRHEAIEKLLDGAFLEALVQRFLHMHVFIPDWCREPAQARV
jgi:hypothetical protein